MKTNITAEQIKTLANLFPTDENERIIIEIEILDEQTEIEPTSEIFAKLAEECLENKDINMKNYPDQSVVLCIDVYGETD